MGASAQAIGTVVGAIAGAGLTWWMGGAGAAAGASIGSILMGAGAGASVGAATATLIAPPDPYFTPQASLSYAPAPAEWDARRGQQQNASGALNARDAATLMQTPDLLDMGDAATKRIRNQSLMAAASGDVGEPIAPKSPIMTEDERERRRIQLAQRRRDTIPSLLGGSAPGEPLL